MNTLAFVNFYSSKFPNSNLSKFCTTRYFMYVDKTSSLRSRYILATYIAISYLWTLNINTQHYIQMCSILALLHFSPLFLIQQNHSNMMGNIKSIAPANPPTTPPTIAPVLSSSSDASVEQAPWLLAKLCKYIRLLIALHVYMNTYVIQWLTSLNHLVYCIEAT